MHIYIYIYTALRRIALSRYLETSKQMYNSQIRFPLCKRI